MENFKEQIIYGIEKICNLNKSFYENEAKNMGLSVLQLNILKYIFEKNSSSLTDISLEFELSKATISEAIKKLEVKGYIKRNKSKDDSRKYHLLLTEKGQNSIEKIVKDEFGMRQILMEFDREELLKILNQIKNILLKISEKNISKRVVICIKCRNFSKIDSSHFYCSILKKKFSIKDVKLNCKQFH